MGEYALYVERVAANAALGMQTAGKEPDLAPELVARHGRGELSEGLRGLRWRMAGLYADMGRRPDAYGIPPVPDSKVNHAASRRKVRGPFESPLKALYALGLVGCLDEPGQGSALVAPLSALDALCRALGVRDVHAAIGALQHAGFAIDAPGAGAAHGGPGTVTLRGGDCAHLPTALKVFADVCRLWERGSLKVRQLPHAFILVDLRILRRTDARARLPKLTPEDVLPFAPPHLADDLRDLSAYLDGLGYRADVDRANLLDGDCHVVFVGARHGKTIFGYTVCRGWALLRLSFRDIGRMVPDIDECPPALRRAVLSQGCGKCGGTGCGRHITVTLDGEVRHICYFGIQHITRWEPGDLPHIKRLLSVQDRLYASAAG